MSAWAPGTPNYTATGSLTPLTTGGGNLPNVNGMVLQAASTNSGRIGITFNGSAASYFNLDPGKSITLPSVFTQPSGAPPNCVPGGTNGIYFIATDGGSPVLEVIV